MAIGTVTEVMDWHISITSVSRSYHRLVRIVRICVYSSVLYDIPPGGLVVTAMTTCIRVGFYRTGMCRVCVPTRGKQN